MLDPHVHDLTVRPHRNFYSRYAEYWEQEFRNQPGFDPKFNWVDLKPAYDYAFDKRGEHPSRHFDEMEAELQIGWERVRGKSRLGWQDARAAVRAGWHAIEQLRTGAAERDER